MTQVVWTPKLFEGTSDFVIFLDREFAKKAMKRKLSLEEREWFQKEGTRIFRLYREDNLTPYLFYENSLLISQINIGRDGKWIAPGGELVNFKPDSDKPIEYHSHNLRGNGAWPLIHLFSHWADYAPIVFGENSY